MTESEFIKLADAIFIRIENALDISSSDIDCSLNGPVLEIEFDNGEKIIINRHTANQEIWIAAKSGGFHYCFQKCQWLSTSDSSELFSKLSELIQLCSGERIQFH